MSVEGFDPELRPVVSIPEPAWVRNWRTFFRSRPACYPCRIAFRTRSLSETHWLRLHYSPPPTEGPIRPVAAETDPPEHES